MPYISSDLAFMIALLCAWLAAIVWMLWPTGHVCHDPRCTRDQITK